VLQVKREITIDGKTYQVEFGECPIGTPFSVKVNNKTREVTLEEEPNNNAKGFEIEVNGKSYQIELPSIEKNAAFSIKINNIPLRVEIKSAAPRIAVVAPTPVSIFVQKTTKAVVEGAVTAPMAGKIISIKVKKGDAVKMGTVLCVLEAMKMENEITAPKSGVVEEVMVQEGKPLNEGDVLVVIK